MSTSQDPPVLHTHRGKTITADEWKILKLVDHWQFFITPTFKDLGSRSGRIQRLNNWLRWVARRGNTTKRYLIYVVRWERGEIGDRPHCHLFLGGMKDIGNPISMSYILANEWYQRHGRCEARVFDRGHLANAASYLGGARPDWEKNDRDWGKNRYEINKFGRADTVHFSKHARSGAHFERSSPLVMYTLRFFDSKRFGSRGVLVFLQRTAGLRGEGAGDSANFARDAITDQPRSLCYWRC